MSCQVQVSVSVKKRVAPSDELVTHLCNDLETEKKYTFSMRVQTEL